MSVEVFDGGFIPDEGADNVAAVGGGLFADEDVVAGEDAGFDHGVALDAKAECVAAAADHGSLDANVVEDVFVGEEGLAGGDAAEDRHVEHVAVAGLVVGGCSCEGAFFAGGAGAFLHGS